MTEQSAPPVEALDRDVAVTIDDDAHIAIVEVRRGPHNFFDLDVLTRLAEATEELAQGDTRAVVLCAEGKNFCAGADFSGRDGELRREGAPHIYDMAIRLFEQPLPIVAAVQGAAIGGGLGLAMAADFRVAGPSSKLAANFSLLGFHQGFALSVTLPLVVGHQAALDLLYTGRRIDGETAHRIGLCDDLVADSEIRQRAIDRATDIAAAAPLATRSIRQTMRGPLVEEARAAMVHERAEQERLQQTADFAEGIAAVGARRPATFVGR
ncbi:enoyl-CoA hydratase/isomerase family protein [Ilumatobacter nonamiensis]|uniref:enoyl-CoA hydratase/isomerase family protein n=1 Tax=Ilumatobacter nonamiensis TaxID=467093 RepID=UPI00034CF656|nr:enoyl-CoA hydratase/isomerase family protein [Ilumatobacter nonamiensis]